MKVAAKLVHQSKAVAIVLGHLGVSQQGLERYGEWYTSRGCSVILAASPIHRFFLNLSMRQTCERILEETSLAVEKSSNPHSPVLIHSFSNGGCFLLYEIEKLVEERKHSDPKIQMIAERMAKGYQLFDSCPCYVRLLWDGEHVERSFPNPSWSAFGRRLYANAASAGLTFWCTTTFAWSFPSEFWRHFCESRVCLNQIFVYTTTDMASDASAVDRLIERRLQNQVGSTCQVHRFEDSNHCQLDVDHPEEYQAIIDKGLRSIVDVKKVFTS